MKRIMAMALVCLMVCLALTSCGGSREKVDLSGVKQLSDLNGSGASLAAQSDTYHIQALREQVQGVKVSDYDSFSLLLTALTSGAIDGYVAEEPTAWSVCAQNENLTYLPLVNNETGFTATDADVGIAVAFKTGSDMVARVNEVIAKIPQATRAALMRQMVSAAMNPDAALGEDIALSSSSTDTSGGVLRSAMECDYQPYNWMQTTDANGAESIANSRGYANGYDVQVAKFIAAELGMRLEIYAYKWGSLIPAVQSGSVDGIIAGMSPTAEREAEVDFTDCYWSSNLVVIIKK